MARHAGLQPPRFRLHWPPPWLVAGVIIALVVILRWEMGNFGQALHGEREETVIVSRVVDGDTADLADGRRVRLLGIDAPEAGYGDQLPERFAAESTAWLKDQIEGQPVRLRVGAEETDRYGRTLAWITDSGGRLINQSSLEAGMSKLLDAFGLPPELEPDLRQAESRARVQRLGVWAPANHNVGR